MRGDLAIWMGIYTWMDVVAYTHSGTSDARRNRKKLVAGIVHVLSRRGPTMYVFGSW